MYIDHARANIPDPHPADIAWAKTWYLRKTFINDLHVALCHHQLEVYYQPVISLTSGLVRGVEALVRWRHPMLGLLRPTWFLPIAENAGAMPQVGHWLIDEVSCLASDWVEPGFPMRFAINVSAQQLRDIDLGRLLLAASARYEIPLTGLELELEAPRSEADRESMERSLPSFRDLGLHLTLDRFVGDADRLSSFAEMPFDTVKIDRSMIRGMERSERSLSRLTEISACAKQSGLEIVAVGTEFESQVDMLKSLNFDAAQGFYYAPPSPCYRLEYWMEGRV